MYSPPYMTCMYGVGSIVRDLFEHMPVPSLESVFEGKGGLRVGGRGGRKGGGGGGGGGVGGGGKGIKVGKGIARGEGGGDGRGGWRGGGEEHSAVTWGRKTCCCAEPMCGRM